MNERARELLSIVVAPRPVAASLAVRIEAAVAIVVEGTELPESLALAIDEVLSVGNADSVLAAQRAVLSAGPKWLRADRFVALVLYLFSEKEIRAPDAARVLAGLTYDDREACPQAMQQLLEVADAVVEDERDGVLQTIDDNAWADALGQFEVNEGANVLEVLWK
jgi:hypothetical protein